MRNELLQQQLEADHPGGRDESRCTAGRGRPLLHELNSPRPSASKDQARLLTKSFQPLRRWVLSGCPTPFLPWRSPPPASRRIPTDFTLDACYRMRRAPRTERPRAYCRDGAHAALVLASDQSLNPPITPVSTANPRAFAPIVPVPPINALHKAFAKTNCSLLLCHLLQPDEQQ